MRKKVLLICSILVAFTMVTAIKPTQAAPTVEDWKWDSPFYEGPDTYLLPAGGNVIAYKASTTATLIIKVYSDLADKAPFKVRVHMDWSTDNITSDEIDIDSGQWYTFTISIPVPATTVASNLVLHSYITYVEYTVGGTVNSIADTPNDSNFAVYSDEQANAQKLSGEYDSLRSAYRDVPTGVLSLLGMTSKAKGLWTNASVESSMGAESYRTGNFADAATHYGNALNDTRDAITSDISKTGSFEDSLIGLIDAMKNQMAMQGTAFLIASIGFLLMGIGVLIYLIRRSRPPAA